MLLIELFVELVTVWWLSGNLSGYELQDRGSVFGVH